MSNLLNMSMCRKVATGIGIGAGAVMQHGKEIAIDYITVVSEVELRYR